MAAFDTYTHHAKCRDKGKGSDPCVLKLDCTCTNCNELTTDQRAQLATPSYEIKKEKRDSKSDRNEAEDTSFALVNQALVLVVGLVNDQKKSKSPEKTLAKDKGKKKQSTPSKPAKPSTNSKIETLDQK